MVNCDRFSFHQGSKAFSDRQVKLSTGWANVQAEVSPSWTHDSLRVYFLMMQPNKSDHHSWSMTYRFVYMIWIVSQENLFSVTIQISVQYHISHQYFHHGKPLFYRNLISDQTMWMGRLVGAFAGQMLNKPGILATQLILSNIFCTEYWLHEYDCQLKEKKKRWQYKPDLIGEIGVKKMINFLLNCPPFQKGTEVYFHRSAIMIPQETDI